MCDLTKKTFDDETVQEMVNFLLMLRKISRANYKKSREYRRHVNMAVVLDGIIINVSIDKIKEYYEATIRFVEYSEKILSGVDDAED